MSRETKADRAVRIVAERRLTVDVVGDPARAGLIVASCRGESEAEVYKLGYDPRGDGRWACTCEANASFHRVCAHLLALKLVTVKA